MNRSKLPTDLGELDGRFREWLQQHGETVMRARKVATFTFALANTEYRIRHKLPNKPTGFVVCNQDKAGSVYRSKNPDKFYVYLKSDTAALTVDLEIS